MRISAKADCAVRAAMGLALVGGPEGGYWLVGRRPHEPAQRLSR